MKIIFFGTDELAKAHLKALVNSSHQVLLCVTSPDKPKGRGLKVEACAVKSFVLEKHIPILEPEDLKDESVFHKLKSFSCDLFVVIAYGKILPFKLLQVPYLCAMNVHASLLPQYRGAAPINWALINAEKETGISIIKMNTKMDAGDVFVREKIPIESEDTAVSLKAKMFEIGPELLLKTIDCIEKNSYTLTVQDDTKVSFAPKLTKEMGCINWRKSSFEIHNLVRGLLPWPTAYTFYQGKLLKILKTQVIKNNVDLNKIGQVVEMTPEGFVVACREGFLLIKRVHLQASKPMEAADFIRGHKIKIGEKFE